MQSGQLQYLYAFAVGQLMTYYLGNVLSFSIPTRHCVCSMVWYKQE